MSILIDDEIRKWSRVGRIRVSSIFIIAEVTL